MTDRSSKACRERWNVLLSQDAKKLHWTQEEDQSQHSSDTAEHTRIHHKQSTACTTQHSTSINHSLTYHCHRPCCFCLLLPCLVYQLS